MEVAWRHESLIIPRCVTLAVLLLLVLGAVPARAGAGPAAISQAGGPAEARGPDAAEGRAATEAGPTALPPRQSWLRPKQSLGMPIFPSAEFIASYDAGRGQRYYLFGTNNPFTQIVEYYKTVLKQRGELVYDEPPAHMFEVGRFREETMAFPPGVTVKDYALGGLARLPQPQARRRALRASRPSSRSCRRRRERRSSADS